MLSKETEQKLDQLFALMDQRIEIDNKIEALLGYGNAAERPALQRLKVRKHKHAKPKGRPREERIVPEFTDAEIEKMIRESDEGKTARQMMQKYGFRSTHDWYLLKSKYKNKKVLEQTDDSEDLPESDEADDEEEPEEEPVVQKPKTNSYAIQKVRSYQCDCGYGFQSRIPPQLIER